MGCYHPLIFRTSTTLKAVEETTRYNIRFSHGSGFVISGGFVRYLFRSLNAFWHSSLHLKTFFFLSAWKKVEIIRSIWRQTCLRPSTVPVSFYTSLMLRGGWRSSTALIWFGSTSIPRLVTKCLGIFLRWPKWALRKIQLHVVPANTANVCWRCLVLSLLCFDIIIMTSM